MVCGSRDGKSRFRKQADAAALSNCGLSFKHAQDQRDVAGREASGWLQAIYVRNYTK